MVFIFAIILAALFFGAASSDNIVIGGAIENTNRNAPFVIQNYFAIGSILTLLMTTAFASAAAAGSFCSLVPRRARPASTSIPPAAAIAT